MRHCLHLAAVVIVAAGAVGSAAAQTLPPGRYVCSMSSAGGQFPLTIGSGTYTDRAGKSGRFTVKGDRVTFTSGSLAGQFSKILGPGKFGLSMSPNGMFYGVCDLQV